MQIAAISFSDPLMLAGLLAALVPVVLHLLNRIRAPVVPFPTLRFLKLTAERTARRRQIQQYFLLFVRVIVFAMVAMAVASPLIRGGSAALAYGMVLMLLVGLALLVLGGVLGASASKPTSAAPGSRQSAVAPNSALRLFFSVGAIAAALLLGGYATYGLVSDRYFSGNRGEFSGRSSAVAIVFDNSHSMLATEDGQTRLARAKGQVRQILGQTLQPAEAAILPTNRGDPSNDAAAPGLTRDMTRLVGYLDSLTPRGGARPMQERIRAALALLGSSTQPTKMLIIASDFTNAAFADAEVFAPMKGLAWRKDLQVVFMPIRGTGTGASTGTEDAGIVSFAPAAGTQRPALGAEIVLEALIVNNGEPPNLRDFALTVDGKPAQGSGPHTPRVTLGAGGTTGSRVVVKIPYRLTRAGAHVFGLETNDHADAMEWNDRRAISLEVAEQVKVLVIGAEPPVGARSTPPPRSAAFYLMAALAPYEGNAAIPWSIQPTYRGISQLGSDLQDYAAVFMCDVPTVSAEQADALAAYVRGTGSGGRIVWILGPNVDAAVYNQVLTTRGLLPSPLGAPVMALRALALDWVDMRAGLFGDLFDSQDPFRALLVTGHWTLAAADVNGTRGTILGKLSDDSPLLVQRSNGSGRIYTLLTSPAAAWSNLGGTVLLVPMASRMTLGDFQELGPAQYQEGDLVTISIAIAPGAPPSLDVTTPDGSVINVKPTGAEARWFFDRTFTVGTYRWRTPDGRQAGQFVINPPGEEADLNGTDVPALARESNPPLTDPGSATIVATDVPSLLAQLERRSEGTSLTPGFLALVLMLAVVEAMMANRQQR